MCSRKQYSKNIAISVKVKRKILGVYDHEQL